MINGDKTVLRAWSAEDLPKLQTLRNDLQLQQQLMARPRSSSIDQVRQWLANKTGAADTLLFVVADKSSNQITGYVQVAKIDALNGTGWLGICICPEMQGRGYGREAIILLEGYLRDVFMFRKLLLEVLARNEPAQRLYSKLGFSEVGRLRKHFYIDNEYSDVILMEKLIRE